MRVLITGPSGTKKATVAQKLVNYRLAKLGIDPSNSASNREIQWFEVESEEWLKTDFLNFVTAFDEATQACDWANALRSINETLLKTSPKDCLLLIHAAWYRNGRFFSPISWGDLLFFQPDCIVTLIDDVYDMWQRIEEGPHDTHFSLDEILSWRSVEIANSRTVATNLRPDPTKLNIRKVPVELRPFFGRSIPHFVVSVKHSLETLHRLIFEQASRPLVYASFPITRTRGRRSRVADIDSFRTRLCEAGGIVIDPLTIDELRLGEDDPAWLELRNDSRFREYQSARWKIADPVIEPPTAYDNPFRGLSGEQIERTARAIQHHVVDRDLRLVAQCQRLIAYRPFYPKEGEGITGPPSLASTGGVTGEINYALGLGKAVWAFHPRCDYHPEQEENFFNEIAVWGRVRRFPKKTGFKELPDNSFDGFDELLSELSKLVH